MKNGRWANLFGTVLAGATVGTVFVVSKKMTKKYGQSPKTQKMFDTSVKNIANSAINAFLNTDEQTIEKITEFIK